MIRRARRKHSELDNVMFVVGEAEEIPWDANFFDRVISVESAYYWPDPRRALREIFRVLIEGGSAWLLINYYRDNPHAHHWSEVLTVPAHLLSAEDWSAMFREAGFAGVAARPHSRSHAGARNLPGPLVPRRRPTPRLPRTRRPPSPRLEAPPITFC